MHNSNSTDSPGSIAGDSVNSSLLRVVGLRKGFPGVQAIADGTFDLRPGEIHALVGENGAGKSTMIKVLTGVHQPDAGQFFVNDNECHFNSPIDALCLGIVAIYQEFTLIPFLSVTDNLFLGREIKQAGMVQSARQKEKAREILTN